MAGWLFADLFLLLLVTALAVLPAKGSTAPEPGPTASSSAGSSAPPSAPPPSPTRPAGLDPEFLTFTIPVSPAALRAGGGALDQFVTLVEAEMRQRDLQARKVGFVLVFATDTDPDRGVTTGTKGLDLLRQRSDVFRSAVGFGYWGGQGDDFELKVFLLN
ncbi:hypothetical protein Daura_39910 [Dactylosporangium aurantiacum]|uniref:Uncharacterized protein n=1 Tax=Dactylosporangium aurantiacum TaxID=35754 RepID=A0A9Q9IGH2_9ACTN|nr:hypothetical protein [Dactylosporangium aurantiacum]MDG6101408.1 hypothetical protein [Dactylosporangium aurantiacum]UWZ52738.1 hypothetical protein Daura_39910 [Dactylosporangium aurantiacum]